MLNAPLIEPENPDRKERVEGIGRGTCRPFCPWWLGKMWVGDANLRGEGSYHYCIPPPLVIAVAVAMSDPHRRNINIIYLYIQPETASKLNAIDM